MKSAVRLTALLLAGAVLLGGCGGGSSSPGAPSTGQQSRPAQGTMGGPGTTPAQAGETPGVTADTILLGAALPLSGPTAYGGKGGTDGLNLYFDYINEQGGVNGRKIKLIVEDNAYDPGKTVAAVRKLVTVDKVFALPGVFGTAPFLAVRDYLQENKVSAFGWGPASQAYLGAGSYLYGIGTPYEYQGAITMDFIATDLKGKEQGAKVAIVFPDDAYGEAIVRGVQAAAKYHGMEVLLERVPRQTSDFGTTVLNLKRAGATHVIAVPPRTGTAALMKEAEAQGLNVTFFTPSDANTESAIFQLAGLRYVDRFYGTTAWSHWDDLNDYWVKWARDRLTAQGKQQVIREKNLFFWFGMLHAMVTVEALKRAGPNLTREAFVQALDSFDPWDPGGISAPIKYKGETFRLTGRTAKISKAKVVNGEVLLETITPFRSVSFEVPLK